MSTDRQRWAITFESRNYDATATIEVRAYDEDHAIRLATESLHSDFNPQLTHIELKGN